MTQLEALKEIARRDGGLLRPAAVVEAAMDENSPLHSAFCWDDTVAAEKYRILQAQHLIRSIRVEVEDCGEKIEVPVFVGVSADRDGSSAENPYRILEDMKQMPDLMRCAVNDAIEQLEALRIRYQHLKELADVWAAIAKHKRSKA